MPEIPAHIRDHAIDWALMEPAALAWLTTWTGKPAYSVEPKDGWPPDGFYQITQIGGPGTVGQLRIERAVNIELDSVHPNLGHAWQTSSRGASAMLALAGQGMVLPQPVGEFYVDEVEEIFAPARETPDKTPGFKRITATYQLVIRPRHTPLTQAKEA